MKRLLIALALVVGVAVSGDAAAQSTYPRPGAAPQRPHVLTHVPANTPGALLDGAGAVSDVIFDGRHNYAIQSQTLNVSWGLGAATVAAGGIADPWGGTASWLLKANSGSAEHGVNQTATGNSTMNVWSIYAKAGTHRYITFRGVSATRKGTFDLQTCTTLLPSSGTALVATLDPSGWCRISAAGDFTAGGYGAWDITAADGNLTYNATGLETVYLTGAQFNAGAMPTAYVPTTTTAITTAAVDLKGLAWTEVGDVPYSTVSPAMPAGFGTGRRAIGPLSDTNYFGYATTSDPLDSTGDRYGCIAFIPTGSYPAFQYMLSNGVFTTDGYYVGLNATTGSFTFTSGTPSAVTANGGVPVANALNIGCWWRTGSVVYAKLNRGPTGFNATGGTEVSGTATMHRLGRANGANASYPGQIVEVIQGLGAPAGYANAEAWATAQIQQALTNGDPTRPLFSDATTDKMHLVGNAYSGTMWNGPAWTSVTNGTPAYSDTFVPPATQGQLNRGGAGPFADANYFSFSASSDVLDSTGDRWICLAWVPAPGGAGTNQYLQYNGTAAVAGHGVLQNTTGNVQFVSNIPAATGPTTGNSVAYGGLNAACAWRSGTSAGSTATLNVQLNLGAVSTVSGVAAEVAGTAYVERIGRYNGNGFPVLGQILQVTQGLGACPVPAVPFAATCAGFAAYQQARALGLLDAHRDSLSVTRTTTETYEVPAPAGQTLWTAPAGAPATGPDGIGVFRGTANVALQSDALDNAAWVNDLGTAQTVTADQYAGPPGGTTMDRVVTASPPATNVGRNVVGTVASSAGPFTASGWIRSDTGTANQTMTTYCVGGPLMATCTCARVDGTACTAAMTANECHAHSLFGTTPARMSMTFTCTAAVTSVAMGARAGQTSVSAGTAGYGGMQLEVGATASPLVPTTTTAAARNATLITTQNKITAQDTTWCVAGVYTPYANRAWARTDGIVNTLWSTGTYNAANSGRAEVIGSNLIFTVVDGNGTASEVRYGLGALTGSRTVRTCIAEGRQALYVDGVLAGVGKLPVAGDWQTTPAAAWTTVPATWATGARGDNSNHFDGYVRDWKVENTSFTKDDLAALDARLALTAPFTSIGALIDEDATTTFHWVADEWNLARYPEALDAASWGVANAAVITADQALAPNNTFTADKVANGGNANGAAGLTLALPVSTTYTVSLWARADTATSLDFGLYCAADGWRVPSVATTLTGPGTTTVLGNLGHITGLSSTTWTRSRITVTTGATVTGCVVYIYPDSSFSTTAGNAAMVWGVQVIRGTSALPYRSPPVNNLLSSPMALSDTTRWTAAGAAGAPQVTDNQATAPDGTLTADRVIMPAVPAGSGSSVSQTVSVGTTVRHTCSFWIKGAVGGETTYVYVTGAAGGAVATRVTATTEWAQYSATGTPNGNPVYCVLGTNTALGGMTATAGGTFYVWNATLTRPDVNGDTAVSSTWPVTPKTGLTAAGFGTGRRYVGPFTDTDYFQPYGTSLSDPLDATGDRWGIMAFNPSSTSAVQLLYMNGGAGASGHRIAVLVGGAFEFQSYIGVAKVAATANTAPVGALSVGCWWRTGNNISVKLNNGATVTVDATAAEVIGTNAFAKVGRYDSVGAAATAATITEMMQGLGAPAGYSSPEAWCLDQTDKALAQGDPVKPLFTPPSNTVMHLRGADYTGGPYWGSAFGGALEVGAVAYSDAFVPPLDGTRMRRGYGPLALSSYGLIGSGVDAGDLAGDWTGCIVMSGPPAGYGVLMSDVNGTTSGWILRLDSTGTSPLFLTYPAASVAPANTIVEYGYNVVCVGREGANAVVKLNGGTRATSAATLTPATTIPLRIGWESGVNAWPGAIHEVWFSNASPTDARLTSIQNKVLARLTGQGSVITTGRTTLAATEIARPAGSTAPVVVQVPAGAPAISPNGVGAWKTATNAILNATSACAAGNVADTSWTFYQLTCANDVTTGPDGRPADQFTQLLVNGGPYQTRNHPSTTTVSTASVYGKMTGAAAGYISAMARCGAGLQTACTCARDDNGPCTAVPNAPFTNDCGAKALIDPGKWVRLTATVTCNTTSVSSTCAYYPGEIGVSNNSTAYLADFQCESGPYATPFIYTPAASAVQRNADALTTTMPADFAYATLAQNSEAICSAPWSVSGSTCTQTSNVPFGPFTGYATLTTTGSNQYQTQVVTVPSSTGPFTATWWAQRGTSPGGHSGFARCGAGSATSVSCSVSDGTACTATTSTTDAFFHVATMPADPVKITGTFSCTAPTTSITARLYGGYFNLAGTTLVTGYNLTQSSTALPYLKAGAAAAYSDQKWCIRAIGTVGGGSTWGALTQRYLLTLGTDSAANTLRLRFTTAERVVLDIYDSAGTLNQTTVTHGYANGTTHILDACNNNGTVTLWGDGVLLGTAAGAGTGLWSGTPPTLYIGGSSVGSGFFDGWVRGVRAVKGITTPLEIDNLYGVP